MAEIGTATVGIEPDLSKVDKAGKQAADGVENQFTSAAKKIGVALAGAFAISKGLDFGNQAIKKASDLNEAISKSNAIFGANGKAIEEWAAGAAKGFGQSTRQALDAAGTFGNLFTQLGVGTDAAAGMSTKMVELASDFASFQNADISQVLDAQAAAFRGEYDALQRFVPTISAAAVEQKALQMTGKATTKELTAQEKALAVNALMLAGAGVAAGDFARASDGLANKTRIQNAEWENQQAVLGQKLLPIKLALTDFIITRLIPAFAGIVSAVSSVTEWLGKHREVAIALGIAIGVVTVGLLAYEAAQLAATAATKLKTVADGIATAAQWAFNAAVAANPFVLAAVALAALVVGIVIAYQKVGWFRDIVDTLWSKIRDTFGWIRDNWPLLLAILTGPFGLAALAIVKNWDDIIGGIKAIPGKIRDAVADFLGAGKDIGGAIVGGIVEGVKGAGGVALDFAAAFGRAMRDFIDDKVLGAFRSALLAMARGLASVNIPGIGRGFDAASRLIEGLVENLRLPSFDKGGIVPGPIGQPRLAVVHGGEVVTTRDDTLRQLAADLRDGMATPQRPVTVNNYNSGRDLDERELVRMLRNTESVLALGGM